MLATDELKGEQVPQNRLEVIKKTWQQPLLILIKNEQIQSGSSGGREGSNGLWSLS